MPRTKRRRPATQQAAAFSLPLADPDEDGEPKAPKDAEAIPVTTGPRARRALQVARLAADEGLLDLSLTAVEQALGGGAPLGGGSPSGFGGGSAGWLGNRTGGGFGGGGMFAVPGSGAVGSDERTRPLSDYEIARILTDLAGRWEKAGADPARAAAALTEVVLPSARPGEAFVYPVTPGDLSEAYVPRDAVTPLLEWVAKADAGSGGDGTPAADELAARLAARDGSAGPAVALVRARYATVRGDGATVAAELAKLTDAAAGGTPAIGGMALLAALPALNAGIAPDAALAALEAGVEANAAGGSGDADHYRRLAAERLARGDLAAAESFVDRALAATREQYQNYSGDYGVRQVRITLREMVGELARGGAARAALVRLEEYRDLLPPGGAGSSDGTLPPSLTAHLTAGLNALPPAERFDVLLRWSIPATTISATTRTAAASPLSGWNADAPGGVRALVGSLPADLPPAAFGKPAEPARAASAAAGRAPAQLTGTALALGLAAAEAGQTADLAAALDAADARRRAARERLAAAEAAGDDAPDEAANGESAADDAVEEEAVDVAQAMRAAALRDVADPVAEGEVPPPAFALAAAEVAAATARLAAGLPADLPAAFAATETLRTQTTRAKGEWADEPALGGTATAGQDAVAANLLLIWAALGDPATQDAAAAELGRFGTWAAENRKPSDPFRAAAQALKAEADALKAAADAPPPGAAFGPWRPAAIGSYGTAGPDRPPWVIHHGQAHATGAARANLLAFRYPLTGSFSAEIVASDGNRKEGHALFGGLIREQFPWNRIFRLRDLGGERGGQQPAPWLSGGDQRVRFEVSPERVVTRIGGRVMHVDDDPPTASPFLALAVTDGRRGWFRAVRISGEPTIPAEVDLIAGGRLDGWFSPLGSRPGPRAELRDDRARRRAANGPAHPWEVRDGELRSTVGTGHLTHHRPLFDGDRVRFAFRTVGTTATVAPALDRTAFVLDPAGVRLRWLPVRTPENATDDGGLPRAYSVPAPGALGPIPLKPDDWNEAVLSVDDGVLTLSVNGTKALERKLSAGAGTAHGAAHPDRLFGFAPAPGRAARVRGVTLSGDWPDRLPDLWKPNLLYAPKLLEIGEAPTVAETLKTVTTPDKATSDAGARDIAWFSHAQVSAGAWDFLRSTAALPPRVRLRALLEHAIGSPQDPAWRAETVFSPADPPPETDLYGVETPTAGRRVPTGGRLLSPVLLLAETAAELGAADEVAAAVETRGAWGDFAPAAKAALLAALAYKSGADPAEHLAVVEAHAAGLTKDSPSWQGRQVLLTAKAAADAAAADPSNKAAADAARRLAGAYLNNLARTHYGGGWSVPKRQAIRILADLDDRPAPDPARWVVSPDTSLLKRADGFPPGRWVDVPGEPRAIAHLGGGERDRLFAVRPTGGEYVLSHRPPTGGWSVARVMAGGLGLQRHGDGGEYFVRSLSDLRKKGELPAAIAAEPDDAALVLTVGPGAFAAAVGDGEAFAQPLGVADWDPPLPFVSVQARGDHAGTVTDLALTGEPTVPGTIDLLPAAPGRVPDWWVDAYGDENQARTTAGWTWDADVKGLAAGRDPAAADAETLLVFPRPLGAATETFRFEFRMPAFAPERAGVHAALGGVAFVLSPDGVALHRITHGTRDRTDWTADNLEPVPDTGPLDLSPGVWHAVELTVTGDTATLSLNGAEIHRRPIAPANRRLPGLFRWSGDRAVQVRNVRLTGSWAGNPAAVLAAE